MRVTNVKMSFYVQKRIDIFKNYKTVEERVKTLRKVPMVITGPVKESTIQKF